MSNLTGNWPKAIEKASEATTEIVKATRDGFTFVAGPLREIVGAGANSLKAWRFKRQIRLAEQVQAYLLVKGLQKPSREIPLNFSLPLIERASLEESDELQDVWARMLANAGDAASRTERRTAFIHMLEDMTAFDVMILAKVAGAAPLTTDGLVFTANLPQSIDQKDTGRRPAEPRKDVAISLGNLVRLGCLSNIPTHGGPLNFLHVRITELGNAFIAACTVHRSLPKSSPP